jgi:hypothetical protein
MLRHRNPWRPRRDQKNTRDLKPAGRTPGQNDGLKGVKRNAQTAEQSGNEGNNMQGNSSSA